MTEMLLALDFEMANGREIVLLVVKNADNTGAMLDVLRKHYNPHDVLVIAEAAALQSENAATLTPLLRERTALDAKTTAYICRQQTCLLPVNTPEELMQQLTQP